MKMNFTKIMTMQKKLDAKYKNNGAFDKAFIDQKRILALLVEIGEFANEYAPFKYWKNRKEINKKRVLEEFVDGIHFFSSIINKTDLVVTEISSKITHQDMSIQLLSTIEAVVAIFKEPTTRNVLEAFELYLGNAELLAISFHDIETAYITKNKVNFKRIANGY